MVEGHDAEEAPTEQSNDAWFEANYLDLVERYPRQWIAVADRQVLCSAATKSGARSEAKRIAAGREFSLYFVEPTLTL